MSHTALLFPGQGSQFIGMGHELSITFSEAKEVFQEVDDTLERHLSKLIFYGELEELTQTENAQPSIMAVSIAVSRVIEKQLGRPIDTIAKFCAGHSLGEYSAYCAAGALSLANTTALLDVRGNAMRDASIDHSGAMVAILGTPIEIIEKAVSLANKHGVCAIANDNSNDQVVLSGDVSAIDFIVEHYKDLGLKRAIKLNVSAAFHSPLMEPVKLKMLNALEATTMFMPKTPVISNVDVSPKASLADIKTSLVNQVTGSVRWRESMVYLHQNAAIRFAEIGPGKVLSSIAKKMFNDIETHSICTPDEIESFLKHI